MVDSLIKKKEAISRSSLIFIAVDELPLANLQNNIVLCNTRYYKLLFCKIWEAKMQEQVDGLHACSVRKICGCAPFLFNLGLCKKLSHPFNGNPCTMPRTIKNPPFTGAIILKRNMSMTFTGTIFIRCGTKSIQRRCIARFYLRITRNNTASSSFSANGTIRCTTISCCLNAKSSIICWPPASSISFC